MVAVDQHTGQDDLVNQLVVQFRERSRHWRSPIRPALVEHQAIAGRVLGKQQMADGTAVWIRLEKPVLFINHGEKLVRCLDRLRTAQKQKSFGLERKAKGSQNTGLARLVQVDQQVAAANQVDAGKRRIAQHIVVGKQHLFAYLLDHPELLFFLSEKLLQPGRRYIGRDRCRIQSVAAEVDRPFVNVGGKNMQIGHAVVQRHLFLEQDGHRIGFFPRGAARHPDPHRLFWRTMGQQDGQHIAFKRFESCLVAKVVGDADQHVLKQQLDLFRMHAQEIPIGWQVRNAIDLEPALDAAQDRGPLVLPKIIPGVEAQRRHDVAQGILGKPRRLIAVGNLDP